MTGAARSTEGGSTGIDFPVVPSFLGTAVSGGCGCVAFLAGAALAIALFAPQFLSGFGARVLERNLERLVDGRVEVEDVRLAWNGRQTAGLVRVSTSEGDVLLEGSLTLPSLFVLLGSAAPQGDFGLRVDRLDVRVDREGGSDLARALGLEADETVLGAVRERVLSLARDRGGDPGDRRDLRFDVRVARGVFTGPDGREVRVEDVGLNARSNRLGTTVELNSGALLVGPGDARSGEFEAAFGPDGALVRATARIDPIPADVLRLVGWRRRAAGAAPRVATSPGLHALAAEGALSALEGILEPGARIELALGAAAGPSGADPGPGELRLSLVVAGPAGEVDVEGVVRGSGDEATLAPRADAQRPLLALRGPFPPEAFAALLRPLAPAGVEVAAVPGAGAGEFRLLSRGDDLAVPLGPLAGGVTARTVGRVLRGMRGAFDLSSRDVGARVERAGATRDVDVLRLDHVLTRLDLGAGGAARIVSRWRSPGAPPGLFSVATLEVPGGAGEPTVGLEIVDMPRSLLIAASYVPDEVAALFYERLHRVVVRRLPLATIARGGSLVPAGGLEVEVDPAARAGERLVGTLRNNTFFCDRARFDLSLGDGAVRRVFFEAMMPWLAETRPLGPTPGRVVVELEGLELDLARTDGDRDARVTLRSDPLEARLHSGLVEAVRRGADEDEDAAYGDGWITWAPPPMTYVVDGDSIDHLDVDLPLLDEESARMSGSAEAFGGYTLRGEIERRLLPERLVRGLLRLDEGIDLEAIGVELIPVTIDAPTRGTVGLLFSERVLDALLGPLGVDDRRGR